MLPTAEAAGYLSAASIRLLLCQLCWLMLCSLSLEVFFEVGGAGCGSSGLEGGNDAGAGEAVAVGVDGARHALVGFGVVDER